MKTTSALMNSGLLLNDEAACQTSGLGITPAPSYARDLRVVGQLLERREIGSADLVYVADAYIIRGIQKTNDNSRSGVRFSRLMTRLDAILRGDFRHSLRSHVVSTISIVASAPALVRCPIHTVCRIFCAAPEPI